MIAWKKNVGIVTLVVVLASACGSDADTTSPTQATPATSTPGGNDTTDSVESTMAPPVSTEQAPAQFPVATFSAISEDPVTEELAAKFQAGLEDFAGSDDFAEGGGLTASVMTADGSWSGTTGTADGVRDLQVDDQFAIASITKSVIAAQVMSMVEAGEFELDDAITDHLPPDLQFDTNGATIRQLLNHSSGIPDDYPVLEWPLRRDPRRVWSPAEMFELIPTGRGTAGSSYEYSGANYSLLGLMIEHLQGRPVAEVLRDGVLAIDNVERLVVQPDEEPTEPMAMPPGVASADLQAVGGYLPSLASVSAFPFAGGMASDAPSLARWFKALCAGDIVSQATLTEMAEPTPISNGTYGLGLLDTTGGYSRGAVGHQGELFGYMSWAACLPEEGAVVVVLSNRPVRAFTPELVDGALRPFVDALRSR
jgi:D-alanyl-D-alanine carboxypeptidase